MSDNLQKWMKAQGLTAPQVARRMGYDRVLVWRFATGERPISDGFKWRFAETFGSDTAAQVFNAPELHTPEPA